MTGLKLLSSTLQTALLAWYKGKQNLPDYGKRRISTLL
jgi:hypothetical protein